jgi:hypothetical protein
VHRLLHFTSIQNPALVRRSWTMTGVGALAGCDRDLEIPGCDHRDCDPITGQLWCHAPARPTPSSGKGPKPNVARLVDKPPMSSATPETKQLRSLFAASRRSLCVSLVRPHESKMIAMGPIHRPALTQESIVRRQEPQRQAHAIGLQSTGAPPSVLTPVSLSSFVYWDDPNARVPGNRCPDVGENHGKV